MSHLWQNDPELFSLAKAELFTAVVGDVMDKLGLLHQFLPPQLRPLAPDMVVIGRAMPVLEVDWFEPPGGQSPFAHRSSKDGAPSQKGTDPATLAGKPFGLMLEALDDLKPREVYVCTGSSPSYALWGELMSTRAIKLGAAGAVVDGYSRDTNGILSLKFPTFSYGPYAQDQGPRGKVADFRIPIELGGVQIAPGDVIFGDIDGVCVVPRSAEQEVFRLSLEKARGEKLVRKAIEGGMGAVQAFQKFGIM